jgi:hypothetical protein
MATKIQAAMRVAALVGSFAIVTGCASRVTTEQLDAVRATAEAAQNAANAAQRTATQAQHQSIMPKDKRLPKKQDFVFPFTRKPELVVKHKRLNMYPIFQCSRNTQRCLVEF